MTGHRAQLLLAFFAIYVLKGRTIVGCALVLASTIALLRRRDAKR